MALPRPQRTAKRLYLLAFDHRSSFSRDLLGNLGGSPDRIADLKRLVFEGFLDAVSDGVKPARAGILVDEEYGADVARSARGLGIALAMPVERSGSPEFEFAFGEDFGSRLEDFDPTYAKVLVRYNPEGDAALNARQSGRLRRLSDWLAARDRRLLFELLVPAEAAQLERVGGDRGRYDLELRPGLVVEAMRELHAAGIEPAVWKIEGLDRREDCERIAAQARSGGRDHVDCIVLGRGADGARVAGWLAEAAHVKGFVGFAVGRTLWWAELAAYVAGDLDRSAAAARIGRNYRQLIAAYEARG